MKKWIITGVFGVLVSYLPAQVYTNLVRNPSFEVTWVPPVYYPLYSPADSANPCPTSYIQAIKCKHWFSPTYSSPDYFNCDLQQVKVGHSGKGYMGIIAYLIDGYWDTLGDYAYREYIKTRLKEKLKNDTYYCVTFYTRTSIGISSHFANNLGFYFSNDSFVKNFHYPPYYASEVKDMFNYIQTDYFYAHPQIIKDDTTWFSNLYDSTNWTKIQVVWLPKGGEEFITIGNFKNNNQTDTACVGNPTPGYPQWYAIACNRNQYNSSNIGSWGARTYMLIDDVSVIEIHPAKASHQKEYVICPGTSITLGTDSTEDSEYYWYPTSFLSCTNCPRPVASPTSSITYYLTKKQCSATTTDFVKIIVENQPQFIDIPSSAKICANDTFSLKLKDTLYSISWEPQNYTFIDSNNIWHAFPPYNETYIFTQQWECNKNEIKKDTIHISVDDCNEIDEIPNVFTPNNDGVNDTWHINWKNTKGIKDFIVEIYDRWGLKVYENNNPLFEWNGKKCGQKKIEMLNDECVTGTYYYLIKYRIGKAEREFKGYISLLR